MNSSRRSFLKKITAIIVAFIGICKSKSTATSPLVKGLRELYGIRFSDIEERISESIKSAIYINGVSRVSERINRHGLEWIEMKPIMFTDRSSFSEAFLAMKKYAAHTASCDARIKLVGIAEEAPLCGKIFCDPIRADSGRDTSPEFLNIYGIDRQPLRFNEGDVFIEPEVSVMTKRGWAVRINPIWVRAKNDVSIGVEGIAFELQMNVFIKIREGNLLCCFYSREWKRLDGRVTIQRAPRPTLDFGLIPT